MWITYVSLQVCSRIKTNSDGLLVPQSKIIIETPSYINSIRTWHNIKSKMIPLSINYIKRNINNIFKISSNYKTAYFIVYLLYTILLKILILKKKSKNYRSMSKNGIPIVEDSIYSDLWFDEKDRCP